MPNRLIDLSGNNDQVLLVEQFETSMPYAALSYCWGENICTTVKTTRGNIEQFRKGTIRDAIIVCRLLNIRFLWVDALCIIQDDVDQIDWYLESAMMCDIYSNAHLVIAAEESPSCTSGFLRRLSSSRWKSFQMMFESQDFPITIHMNSVDYVPPGNCETDPDVITKSALSQRAWTFQETILPYRILHFTKTDMIWECNAGATSESEYSAYILPKMLANLVVARPATSALPSTAGDSDDDRCEYVSTHISDFYVRTSPAAVYWAWQRMVEHYSRRRLTRHQDKLTAMSGLAQLVLKMNGVDHTDYFAGLWRGQFVKDLLWHVSGPWEPRRFADYVAPSWSWASVSTGVKYFAEQYQFDFTEMVVIREVKCSFSPLNPTGSVTSGHIIAAGSLWPVALYETSSDESMYTGHNGHAGRLLKFIVNYMWPSERPSYRYEVLLDERLQSGTSSDEYYCLVVGANLEKKGPRVREWFLILRETRSRRGSYRTFERVGIGYHHYKIGPDSTSMTDNHEKKDRDTREGVQGKGEELS
ncbi:hypothetical protein DL768_007948 [Monosporascus sp. mg162]|nr:hypothetical protein DL768_007948 [Monosporascus sp. mg162]